MGSSDVQGSTGHSPCYLIAGDNLGAEHCESFGREKCMIFIK